MSEEPTSDKPAEQEEAKEPEYEQTINGKRVTFRRSYPLKLAHLLPKYLDMARESTRDDYRKRLPLLKLCIESWEHPGDPGKDQSYEDLDVFDDIDPLTDKAMDIVLYRLRLKKAAKN